MVNQRQAASSLEKRGEEGLRWANRHSPPHPKPLFRAGRGEKSDAGALPRAVRSLLAGGTLASSATSRVSTRNSLPRRRLTGPPLDEEAPPIFAQVTVHQQPRLPSDRESPA